MNNILETVEKFLAHSDEKLEELKEKKIQFKQEERKERKGHA